MNPASSVLTLASALVHQAAATPSDRQRHATFIATHLLFSFGLLACAPFSLAFRGAPDAAGILVLAFSFVPLAAALLVARTGQLLAGHCVAALGLALVGLGLWLGFGAGASAATVWIVAAQVEAMLSRDARLTQATGAFNAIILLDMLVVASQTEAPQPGFTAMICGGIAVLYALVVAAGQSGSSSHGKTTTETAMLRAICDAADDVIVGFDVAGWCGQIPSDCVAKLGVPAQDLAGRGFFEHVHVSDRPAFLKLIGDAAHIDATQVATIRLRTADTYGQAPQHLEIEMRARRTARDGDLDTTPIAVVAVLRNVDVRRAQESEIVAARAYVDDAVRSKDHFLASMSHELRTPLNAIIGFSEMLASHTLRPADTAKQLEYAKIINQSGQHLLSVVNSILDMSKIRSGTFAINSEPFEILPLVDQCCDMVGLKAQTGRIEIIRDYPDAAAEIVGDKRACKQILINLLSNAVKFTPEQGQVRVGVRPDGNHLVVSVSDTGIGIGAGDLAKLGDPFFQARSSLSRPYEGTGLGLSVVRGLVGLHGGTIALESELGRGTCVTVRLPVEGRAIGHADTNATIETTARRQPLDSHAGLTDRRMKQVA